MVWKVLLGLALLLALLLVYPLRLELRYHEEGFSARLRVLFLFVRLFPRPPKKAAPAAAEKTAAPAPEAPPRRHSLEAVLDTLRLINDLLPQAGMGLGYILRHTTLSRCRIRVTAAREDAADTALRCGQVNAAFYSAYALAANVIRVKEFRLQVTPDYLGGPESADVQAQLRLRPSSILWGGMIFVFRAGRTLLNNIPARRGPASRRAARQTG